nr:hypothetical protein [Angustibacter aerolatus]
MVSPSRVAAVQPVLPPHRYQQREITETFAQVVLGDDHPHQPAAPAARELAGRRPAPGAAARALPRPGRLRRPQRRVPRGGDRAWGRRRSPARSSGPACDRRTSTSW